MKKIIIVGAGGIGKACGLILLQHDRDNELRLVLADIDIHQCYQANQWINLGLGESREIEKIDLNTTTLEEWNPGGDIILDCTPGKYAERVAGVAIRNNMHYANLTEHVPATNAIRELAKGSDKCFALQTGLAPGFINVLTRKLITDYRDELPETMIRSVKMRVGALSPVVSSPAYYAFTWSPIGVSTEYLNKAEILKNKKPERVNALSDRERLVINGVLYEADHTSGGASDLPGYYSDTIDNLDYKTLRYPGHFDWIEKLKYDLGEKVSPEMLTEKMISEVPFQENDRVLLYISIMGVRPDHSLLERYKVLEIYPIVFNSVTMAAIQRTTAASLAQTAILLLSGQYNGVMLQSRYPVDDFLSGDIIKAHYGTFI